MGGGTVQPGFSLTQRAFNNFNELKTAHYNSPIDDNGYATPGRPVDGVGAYTPTVNNYTPEEHAMSMQADGNTTGFRSKVPQALGSPPQNDVPPVSSVLDTGGAILPQTSGRFPVNNTPELGVTQPSIYNYSPEPGDPTNYNDPEPGGHTYSPEPGGYGYNPEPGGGYSNQYYSEGGLIKDPLEGYDFKRGR